MNGVMRAVTVEGTEEPPVLRRIPVPEPAADEVLVRVEAASVNGFDLMVWTGVAQEYIDCRFPVTLGTDFAGTVHAVGSSVGNLAPGDRVFGIAAKAIVKDGTFCEFVAAPAGQVAAIPPAVEFASAAGSALAGSTAFEILDAIGDIRGKTLVVAGATGGVGTFVVELAAARGAHVIASAQSDEEKRLVAEAGAAETFGYAAAVIEQPDSVDDGRVFAIVHLAGDPDQLIDRLLPGGRFVSTLGAGPDRFDGRDIEAVAISATLRAATLERVAAALAAGEVHTRVQRRYSLNEAPQALDDFRRGTLGKLIVTID